MQHKILIRDDRQQSWLAFSKPRRIYQAASLDEILPALDQIESQVKENRLWAVGWLGYEASTAFDAALVTHSPGEFPPLWFGLFAQCETVELDQLVTALHIDAFQQTVWSLNTDFDQYSKKIHQIKHEIEQGNTYQVNYTVRQYADFDLSAGNAFLGFAANAKYGAFIDTGRFVLCCASPELFFQTDGQYITGKPMKGTAPRGRFLQEDSQFKDALQASVKDRAENLMIVDMIRNDLGRIADPGSVKVPTLFEIEKYPTVWQMTSTVRARYSASLVEILTALFPCASITGAPKANTMKIIHSLESTPRNIYTGSIGVIRPDGSMQFNVAIRTALIDTLYNQAEYGVGGGIVWDSSPQGEFTECLTKSKILTGQGTYAHDLLESLLWTPQHGYFLLDYHLSRLRHSAEYFDFSVDISEVSMQLNDLIESAIVPQRVRLLVSRKGKITLTSTEFTQPSKPSVYRVRLADQPVDSNNVYLYHKTTQRSVYDNQRRRFSDFDDVLLFNQKGEVTESCIANVVVEIDGKKFTPPVDCGLLNGTYRQYLIDKGQLKERVITLAQLAEIDNCYLINSVRKMWPITIEMQGNIRADDKIDPGTISA